MSIVDNSILSTCLTDKILKALRMDIAVNHSAASTTVDLCFLHYFHLDSSEVVQLVQFKFKILYFNGKYNWKKKRPC